MGRSILLSPGFWRGSISEVLCFKCASVPDPWIPGRPQCPPFLVRGKRRLPGPPPSAGVRVPSISRRAIPDLRRFPERLVDDRIERDDAANEFASHGLRVGEFAPAPRQVVDKPGGDPVRQFRQLRGQPAPGAAEIGPGNDDAGADPIATPRSAAPVGRSSELMANLASQAAPEHNRRQTREWRASCAWGHGASLFCRWLGDQLPASRFRAACRLPRRQSADHAGSDSTSRSCHRSSDVQAHCQCSWTVLKTTGISG
jgi:hypothetical protein